MAEQTEHYKKEIFLEKRRVNISVTQACKAAGIGRTTYYRWRKEDPEFLKADHHAHEECIDTVEESVFERALTSDTLGIFVLKSHRRHIYGDKVETTHKGEINIGDKRDRMESKLRKAVAGLSKGEVPEKSD